MRKWNIEKRAADRRWDKVLWTLFQKVLISSFLSFLIPFSLSCAQNYEINLNFLTFSLLTFHFSLLFYIFAPDLRI